jgi:3-oxoacyl-[acyl-carrier protein] reductase
VAVITGGGRGIGRSVALVFAQEGANLVLASRTPDEIDGVCEEVNSLGVQCIAVPTDITIKSEVENLMARAIRTFGQVDILVNNAGVAIHNPIESIREEDWDLTMAVNLKGVFLCTQAVFQLMCDKGSGYILNISSVSGKMGHRNGGAYCASKFAVNGFTETIAAEGKQFGVKAAVVCPGPVDTRMRRENHPDDDLEKLTQPEEVAELVLFLVTQSPTAHTMETVIRTPLM